MVSTITGEVKQWSDLRPSKFHNFNKGVMIDDVWYNFYNADANYLNNIQLEFPAGTNVKITYDETKGYKPISKIEKTTEHVQQALTGQAVKPVPVTSRSDKSDDIARAVALKAAVDFYEGRAFLSESDCKDIAVVITRLADEFLKWLR